MFLQRTKKFLGLMKLSRRRRRQGQGLGWGWQRPGEEILRRCCVVVNGQDQKSPQVGNLELETNGRTDRETYLR